MVSPAIPVEVEDVTAPWLATVLDADVIAVDVLDSHSGTTGRARLGLTYSTSRREDLPATLFVKLAPFDERQRRFVDAVGLGVAEARLYRDLAARLPVRVPLVWFAAIDDEARYIMVLEDLVGSGCRFPRPDDDGVETVAAAIVHELAVLHARFWSDPSVDGELAWLGEGMRIAFGAGGSFIRRAVERFADEMPPVFAQLGELFVAETPAIASLWEVGPHTLAHGDPHFGNLFVDGTRPGFFDWGMVMRRAGMWDVAYVLCNSIPTEVRRAHEHEWIRSYCDDLAEAGINLGIETAWQQYRLFAVYSWSSAVSTAGVGSRWQSERGARAAMERTTAAVADLDCIGALHSLGIP